MYFRLEQVVRGGTGVADQALVQDLLLSTVREQFQLIKNNNNLYIKPVLLK
jgi:hypothetical protein